jgi:hypothetical protein
MPKIGNVESTMGKTAQWMAHARDAVIPTASQLILKFMRQR